VISINDIAGEFLKEAAHDYIGLWAVSDVVRWDLKLSDNAEVKARTLDVVRILMDRGLWPGDYLKSGFHFWDEPSAEAAIARIDREWDPKLGDPPLGESICWFGTRSA
jgi:hypothetical protein